MTKRRSRMVAAVTVLLLLVASTTTALAQEYDTFDPTEIHNVTPQLKDFPDGRICAEGSYLIEDQFTNLSSDESMTYVLDGTEVTVDIDFRETGLFDFTVSGGTMARLFVKSRLYLLYEYEEPVTGATNDGPVTEDDGVHSNAHPNGNSYQGVSHLDLCLIPGEEELTVDKTVETSFIRTHLWDIDKAVETQNGYTETENGEEFPKIWLVGPGDEGDETATWTVDVTYEGFEDSGYNISGEITIENTGSLDAVITSVDDVLGGAPIDVDCGVDFPYTLPADETLTCTYDEDVESMLEGSNEVTVNTERDAYYASEPIVWGDPDQEINETVAVKDISDLFGEVDLGTVTAPNGNTFTYDEDFAWVDYEDKCGEDFTYDNTGTIVETGQSAEATLKVNVLCEELTVDKAVETSFTREHFWSIEKRVETENGYELEGVPKIWLYTDGSGDETATWTVDVTHDGYEDSDFNVSGEITIENTGDVDAVITGVEDVLGGTSIEVDFGVDFPHTLKVGETLTGTYDEDGYFEGSNEVTVTTQRDAYDASEPIVWGDPDDEINETVSIKDISDLFGEVELGTAMAPNDATFTYTKDFAWADYGADLCGDYQYDNTATIVETGQSASATLKVNAQCVITESAWAKGDEAIAFCEYFDNWGWTNPIEPGEYTWDLWAGAGQCDTANGTLVGSVHVVYDGDGYVTVTYNLFEGYTLEETHVYADYDMFPTRPNGDDTVAPGQYYNASPFDGSEINVIAHAVVGTPDPDFGP